MAATLHKLCREEYYLPWYSYSIPHPSISLSQCNFACNVLSMSSQSQLNFSGHDSCVSCLSSGYAAPPPYTTQAPPPQQYPPQPVRQQPVVQGSFDQGARFDPNKPVTIPVSLLVVSKMKGILYTVCMAQYTGQQCRILMIQCGQIQTGGQGASDVVACNAVIYTSCLGFFHGTYSVVL